MKIILSKKVSLELTSKKAQALRDEMHYTCSELSVFPVMKEHGHIDNEDILWMGVHKWKLPNVQIAPLFLENDQEVVVIAPCVMPEAIIVGEMKKLKAKTVETM